MAALTVAPNGKIGSMHIAHILPQAEKNGNQHRIMDPVFFPDNRAAGSFATSISPGYRLHCPDKSNRG
jgi:hypothetical protein